MTNSLIFNGGSISRTNSYIFLTQEHLYKKIETIDVDTKDFKAIYIKERVQGAYIASIYQPKAAFALSYVA